MWSSRRGDAVRDVALHEILEGGALGLGGNEAVGVEVEFNGVAVG
jgi:hypothetical protein